MYWFIISIALFWFLLCEKDCQISARLNSAENKPVILHHHLRKKSDFPVNEDNRLLSNWFIHSNSDLCKSLKIVDILSHQEHHRKIGIFDELYAGDFFEPGYSDSTTCSMICFDIGAPIDLINYVFSERKYVIEDNNFNESQFLKWFNDECLFREVGFVSNRYNPVDLHWVDPDTDKRILISEIEYGEQNVVFQVTRIGHVFEVRDSESEEFLGAYQIFHDAFIVIGDMETGVDPTFIAPGYGDNESGIQITLNMEYQRSQSIKRTFTKLGFDKSRLPNDTYCSMSTFYYNNRNNLALEAWKDSKGLYVNWWQVDSQMIVVPWKLKTTWQERLKGLAEDWSKTTLEQTDMYGFRRYNEGARLLSHVDRTSTHAVSLIINIAQGNVLKPWPVEIYDHGGRLHEIEMNPGDIVYYESAKCLHGRNQPLTGPGSYYVNLFTHYRPEGDLKWHKKETPSDQVPPLLELSQVDVAKELPYLSPTGRVLTSGDDLFSWWVNTSPSCATGVREL